MFLTSGEFLGSWSHLTYKGAEGLKKRRGETLWQSWCVYTAWAEPINLDQTPFPYPFSHKIQ